MNVSQPKAESDSKPQKPMDAYSYFLLICRQELELNQLDGEFNQLDGDVCFLDFSKKCASEWEMMTEEDKKTFQQFAAQDNTRFEMGEMENYLPSAGGPLSAFFCFCNESRDFIKKQNPGSTVLDIVKKIGRGWDDEHTRENYAYVAENNKTLSEKDMSFYKKSKVGSHGEEDGGADGDEEDEDLEDDEDMDDDEDYKDVCDVEKWAAIEHDYDPNVDYEPPVDLTQEREEELNKEEISDIDEDDLRKYLIPDGSKLKDLMEEVYGNGLPEDHE